ncbi:MAG: DNA cytosine methyltransferase [Lentilitoribacter sp.]
MSPLNLQRLINSKPGGTWHDWPDSLRAECHRKVSGRGYVSVYARMTWDEVSPTITTQSYGFGNGRFGHPEQNRAISLREAAILQTFPKSYQFVPPNEKVQLAPIGMMIGNAVPVTLGKVIGRSFKKHLM